MTYPIVLIALLALVVSAWLTDVARRWALAHGALDVPNRRSSHSVPTPRGGGIAIVAASTVAFVALAWLGLLGTHLLAVLIVGGLAVAVVGFLDDRLHLRAAIRLTVHLAAAVLAMILLDGVPPLRILDWTIVPGWVGYVLGTLGIAWTLNLFNFMDGIDGLAASEGTFIALGAVLLIVVAGTASEALPAAAVFGAACAGFLLWNWPPARIFMGDVGSGYVGYVIAVLAVSAARRSPEALFVWLILGGAFFVDATVTLVRRFMRRERLHEAHRTHAYQWLARRWQSHKRVTTMFLLINVTWLLPLALLGTVYARLAWCMALVALLPLVIAATAAGAGEAEQARE
jgi:Fuc2NAc and GlcNAc transferase